MSAEPRPPRPGVSNRVGVRDALALITALAVVLVVVLSVSTRSWWAHGDIPRDADVEARRVEVRFVRVQIEQDIPVSDELMRVVHDATVTGIRAAGLTDVSADHATAPDVATLRLSLTELTSDGSHVRAVVRATVMRGPDSLVQSALTGAATGSPGPSNIEATIIESAVRAALRPLGRVLRPQDVDAGEQ
jgi:hypothetical protein